MGNFDICKCFILFQYIQKIKCIKITGTIIYDQRERDDRKTEFCLVILLYSNNSANCNRKYFNLII